MRYVIRVGDSATETSKLCFKIVETLLDLVSDERVRVDEHHVEYVIGDRVVADQIRLGDTEEIRIHTDEDLKSILRKLEEIVSLIHERLCGRADS
jgi:hypothetical protein